MKRLPAVMRKLPMKVAITVSITKKASLKDKFLSFFKKIHDNVDNQQQVPVTMSKKREWRKRLVK